MKESTVIKHTFEPTEGLLGLDEEMRLDWAKELRSGKYKQGSGLMFIRGDETVGDCYCCLGVFEKMHQPEGTSLKAGLPAELNKPTAILSKDGNFALPQNISFCDSVFHGQGKHRSYPYYLNDGQAINVKIENEWMAAQLKMSFDEIATLLEGNPVTKDLHFNED